MILKSKLIADQALASCLDKSEGTFGVFPNQKNIDLVKALSRLGIDWSEIIFLAPKKIWLKPRLIDVIFQKQNFIRGEGLISQTKGKYLGLLTADCLPIIVYDRHQRLIALIHVGFYSLIRQTIKQTIKIMVKKYNSRPGDLLVFIGPGICGRCYRNRGWRGWFKKILFNLSGLNQSIVNRDQKSFLDIKAAALAQLQAAGVSFGQIELSDQCTREDDNWPSYFREGSRRRSSVLTIAGLK